MKITVSRIIALGSYLALLVLMILWAIWLSPSKHFPVALDLLVTVVPLMLTLFGMLKGRVRSHLITSYLSMLYVMHGSVEAWTFTEIRSLALAETLLGLTLFISASFYARWYGMTLLEQADQ